MQPILGYFFELGATYGEQVLPHHEIESWARVKGVSATPFIVEALRKMSIAYINMRHQAKDANCPNPTKPEEAPQGRRAAPEEETPEPAPQHKRLKRKAR